MVLISPSRGGRRWWLPWWQVHPLRRMLYPSISACPLAQRHHRGSRSHWRRCTRGRRPARPVPSSRWDVGGRPNGRAEQPLYPAQRLRRRWFRAATHPRAGRGRLLRLCPPLGDDSTAAAVERDGQWKWWWAAAGNGVGHPRRGPDGRLQASGGRAAGSATRDATKGATDHVDAIASGGAQKRVPSETRAAARPHASPSPNSQTSVRWPGAAPKIEARGDTLAGTRVAQSGVAVAPWWPS